MDELEDKLRRLAPRGPSPELDRRVLEALGAGRGCEGAGIQEAEFRSQNSEARDRVVELTSLRSARPRAAVSVRWALAAALLMGLFGFFAGRTSRHKGGAPQTASTPTEAASAVTVNVIYTGTAPNPFDCTVAADDGLRPVPEIKIQSKPGV